MDSVSVINESAIQERFQEFRSAMSSKPYYRQKCALERQLVKFLDALSPPRTTTSCTAEDIVKFLID